jgi:hypothetical protein
LKDELALGNNVQCSGVALKSPSPKFTVSDLGEIGHEVGRSKKNKALSRCEMFPRLLGIEREKKGK